MSFSKQLRPNELLHLAFLSDDSHAKKIPTGIMKQNAMNL